MAEYLTIDGNPLDLAYTPAQMEIFFNHPERFICVPKGRRLGATHGAANFSIESLIEGKSILWIDTIQNNLDKYFAAYFLPTLKKQLDKKYWRYRTQQKDLYIANTKMDFRSAERPENIEGFAYHEIIINEAGIVLKGQRGRDLWFNSIYPMILDYHASVKFLGTPKGRKAKKNESPKKTSLYFELCNKGLELPDDPKDPEWLTLNYTTYDNPLLDPADIAELAEDIPFNVRAQEIYGKFIDSGDEEVFKEEWFNIVYELPPPQLWLRKIISLDTAFKKGAENDDSAATVWLETRNGYFWIDTFCKKLEFPELLKETEKFYLKHDLEESPVRYMLIEDKMSGQSLIQAFRDQTHIPIKPIQVSTDKLSRASAISPMFETGKVHLLFGAWNNKAINQLCEFNSRFDSPDDIVDTVSQALNYFKSSRAPQSEVITRKIKRSSSILARY